MFFRLLNLIAWIFVLTLVFLAYLFFHFFWFILGGLAIGIVIRLLYNHANDLIAQEHENERQRMQAIEDQERATRIERGEHVHFAG